MVFYGGTQLLVSDKAKQCVADACPQEVEFLPVRYKERRWWLLNATCVLDCLDEEKSICKTFPDGRIMWVEEYWFKESAIANHAIFRIRKLLRTRPHVTDCFKEHIEKAGLRGFKFELLWDSSAEGGNAEEGESEAMGEQKSAFDYVGELDQSMMEEIREASERAAQLVKGGPDASPEQMVEGVCFRVDAMLSQCDESDGAWIPSAAMSLGCLYGDAICREYGWRWMAFGPNEHHAFFGVVSPERNYCLVPTAFVLKILKGENVGPDGQNDNTVALLFGILDGIDGRPGEKGMILLG